MAIPETSSRKSKTLNCSGESFKTPKSSAGKGNTKITHKEILAKLYKNQPLLSHKFFPTK